MTVAEPYRALGPQPNGDASRSWHVPPDMVPFFLNRTLLRFETADNCPRRPGRLTLSHAGSNDRDRPGFSLRISLLTDQHVPAPKNLSGLLPPPPGNSPLLAAPEHDQAATSAEVAVRHDAAPVPPMRGFRLTAGARPPHNSRHIGGDPVRVGSVTPYHGRTSPATQMVVISRSAGRRENYFTDRMRGREQGT